MSKDEDAIETQKLPCKLSQSEREAKTADLVRLEQERSAQEAAKKAKVAEMNALLKQTRAQIDERVKELDEGAEVREVPVRADYDYEAKRVSYVRTDTDETISSREMDSFDLQERLPGHEQDVLPPPAKPKPRKPRKKHGELSDVPDQTA